jgi:thiol-disulfide isomerase/thioredoxin
MRVGLKPTHIGVNKEIMLRSLFLIYSLLVLATGSAFAEDHRPAKLAVGDAPPPNLGRALGGPDVTLDLASGKAYVISFWASWCGPCLQELPILSNIQKVAGTEKMQVIAVNIEDREVYRKLQRHIRDLGLTSAFDPDRKAQDAYGVGPIPHMVIVGRDGRVSAVRIGYSESSNGELAAALNRALAVEPAPNPASKLTPSAAQ